MSQPVKVSDALILQARLVSEIAERSITGQIEYWARLGMAVEPLLRGEEVLALQKAGVTRPLSESIESVDSPEGRQRVANYLKSLPYPHYESAGRQGLLIKIDEDGTRTVGRFKNRKFKPVKRTSR